MAKKQGSVTKVKPNSKAETREKLGFTNGRIKFEIQDREYKGLDEKKMTDLYYYMRLSRAVEEQIVRLYRQGKIFGGVYAGRGNEGITVGSTYALEERDGLFPIHRSMGSFFVKGQSIKTFFSQYLGRANTPSRGRDGNLHLGYPEKHIYGTISHLGAMIPVATGYALGSKLRGENAVALTFIGEGGSNIGDFHEGLNFASVHKVGLILIIENNQFAYSTPIQLQYASEYLSDRAIGYGMHGEVIYGNNVLAVYEAVKKAVDRGRNGEGPSLIEARTMRMSGHSAHDDASYVPKSLIEEWKKRDPIDNYEKYLLKKGIIDGTKIKEMVEKIEGEINEAVEYAENSPFPEPEDAMHDLFA